MQKCIYKAYLVLVYHKVAYLQTFDIRHAC